MYKTRGYVHMIGKINTKSSRWAKWKLIELIIEYPNSSKNRSDFFSFTFINEAAVKLLKMQIKALDYVEIEFGPYSIENSHLGNFEWLGFSIIKLEKTELENKA